MARGVHAGAVSVVVGPGDAVGRELPRERWYGWSGLDGQQTQGQSGCPGDPRELRAGEAPQVEAQGRPGEYLRRTRALRNHPAGMYGYLGADPLQRPQRCWCAGPGAAGCGVSGAAQSGQQLRNQIGSGLCVKGRVGTEERRWEPGGRKDLGVSKGAGPWLLWPPLTPYPRCWGPRPSPLLSGLVSVAAEPRGEGGNPGRGDPQGQAKYGGMESSWYLPKFDAFPALLPVSRSVGVCACRDMRLSWVLTVLSICLSALATATGAEGKRKLQIGVKKRVDHCPMKSRKGDVLHMHYTGKLEDGTEFDSSLPQNQPFVFSLGTGQVIKGWDQGLLGMCEGEKRKLVIPSELGYGERGAPPKIPGGATLVFEVELLKIERRSEL
ncbi:peptidyl-prolyl cis-trans isomerase FKBP2 isoform X1 [Otolemur garnettii]|nr:peptidyl-prolyl cis-trans isomerase FKBP2 isoform X1 [Otolemur garnettii]